MSERESSSWTRFDQAAGRIPLFPLQTVLFPDGLLPLRIFEPRYIDMIRNCLHSACGFGVVAIRSGREVGAAADSHPYGTLAQIVDWSGQADGLLSITALGTQRFQVTRRRVAPDNLVLAEVEWLPADSPCPLPEEYRHMVEILHEVQATAGARLQWHGDRFDDASWVGWRIAELLPLPATDRVSLLAQPDPLARLARLARVLADHAGRA